MLRKEVDIVVIGSGGGGAPLAKELSEAGLKVVILEKGPYYTAKDFTRDELKARRYFYPNINEEPHTSRLDEESPSVVTDDGWMWNCVGGGTAGYDALAWRFKKEDFKMRSILGPISGTTIEDWPISYEDMESYYEKAEYELGVSGKAGINPFESERKKSYPLPPLAPKRAGIIFEKASRKLGYHPFPTPLAVLSKSYDGRPACEFCGFCDQGCPTDAKSSTLVTLIPKALKTGNCEIRPHSMVRKININKQGLAKSVVYFDQKGKEHELKAKLVCVCCTAIESARLLLNSKSNLFPEGLANSSGLVGKNLTTHVRGKAIGFFSRPIDQLGVRTYRSIDDFYFIDSSSGLNFIKGGVAFQETPGSPIKAIRQYCGYSWGKDFKNCIKTAYSNAFSVMAVTEDLPQLKNNVTLDPHIKDKWGIPAARITYKSHPLDLEPIRYIIQRCEEILKAAGAKSVQQKVPKITARVSNHQAGTCRFGNDSQKSVLNKFCQTHDVKNLFVVDGSFMPTPGGCNPALTIMANSFRVADYIKGEIKRGKL